MHNFSEYKELYHYDDKRSLVINEMTGDVRMMKRLSHYDENVYAYLYQNPNVHIPKLFEFFRDNNNLIVIEEFVQGNTFDVLISDHSMKDNKKLQYFLELLNGLTFLHSAPAPIIHRDLKPSNVMITDKGEVKILDYDAAKVYKPNRKGDTTFLGTDGVAAPEQYGFMQSDPRSDIYAVGKMLLAAFPNNSRIQRIAEKATSFDPVNRYSSAQELADVLAGRLSPNLKFKPPFPPPGFRTRKWWKMILASLFYLYMIYTLINYHASDDPIMNTASIIFLIVITIVSIDICNSWSGFFDLLPFVTHKNFFLRSLFKFIFIIVTAVFLLLVITLVIVIIQSLTKV